MEVIRLYVCMYLCMRELGMRETLQRLVVDSVEATDAEAKEKARYAIGLM